MGSRAEIALAREPGSAHRARRFAGGVCADWQLGELRADVTTVVSELVENTLQHTGSPALLRLELLGRVLTVSVSDDDPREARVRAADSDGGYGLRIVQRMARSWGCERTDGGGKKVWAELVA
ncbi:ATP-binding protein [Amycolatopsis acidicola]|uniref:ATP-binding protein n=1 Tax=Amycolatopsis acidicola TaxID=2596893 RepID=A0A5N0UMB7_9PSEU|nr:ATP-binding protein [Amycolatopsis acidicola]KAA9149062.1 ATP-binding protein [Amycolatopsis acidicola]